MINILLVEDEEILGHLIREVLLHEPGFNIEWVMDGESAIENVAAIAPDICILDVMLPKINGFDVARAIREKQQELPIIFLSARSSVSDIISGFESGGNDYLRKPFSIKELVVRVKALINYPHMAPDSMLRRNTMLILGLYSFCTATNILSFEDKQYTLTSREAEILQELIRNRNRLLMKKDILIKIWGMNTLFTSRTMDVYIGRLRKYLVHDPALSIKNVRGYGYKLVLEHIV
jgi:DNA-binding response OmpR family regulator